MKVGIPRALSYYDFFPFWYGFFSDLGIEIVLSDVTTKQTMTTETGQNPKLNITKPTVIYDRTDTMNEFKDINPSLPANTDTNTINEFYKNSRWNNKNNIRSMYTRDHFSRNNAVISTIAKMRYLNAMRQQTDEIRASKRYKPYKSYRRQKHRKH